MEYMSLIFRSTSNIIPIKLPLRSFHDNQSSSISPAVVTKNPLTLRVHPQNGLYTGITEGSRQYGSKNNNGHHQLGQYLGDGGKCGRD